MLATREHSIFTLDNHAQESSAPLRIITADCSNPREIDDGLRIEALPAAQETYRAQVCVADTTSLYNNPDYYRQAMTNVEARYWVDEQGNECYSPMLHSRKIRDLELVQGKVRSAMVVSFVVGKNHVPDQLDISFRPVEAVRNMDYKMFGNKCRYSPRLESYGRAAAILLGHMKFRPEGDDDPEIDETEYAYNSLVHRPNRQQWNRGARINQVFMVAANHFMGKMLQESGRPAIYRTHDPLDQRYVELLPPTVARFSSEPAAHEGLRLPIYAYVTSPLRRLDAFMNIFQAKRLVQGKPVTDEDRLQVATAVQRLNQHAIAVSARRKPRLRPRDVLGPLGLSPAVQAMLAEQDSLATVTNLGPRIEQAS